MTLIVLRAQPGADRTVQRARRIGLAAKAFPLFEAHALGWSPPDPAGFDGLIATSARAFRLGGPNLEVLRNLPVHAVGPATAAAARQAGFKVSAEGGGGLAELMAGLPTEVRLLRLTGRDHAALSDPRIRATLFLYAVDALPIMADLERALSPGALVALHSPRLACHFAAEVDRIGVPRAGLTLVALSPAVAAAAGEGWAAVAIASGPRDAALLCQAAALSSLPGGAGAEERG